jgi:hypothetical protein
MTVSAAAAPIAQNNFSRLPWTHRVNLECHTMAQYGRRPENLTTHFFGFFPTAFHRLFGAIQRRDSSSATCRKAS